MKKYLFLVTAVLLTMSMSMSAQNNQRNSDNRGGRDNRRSEQMVRMTPQERVDLMAKELDLTADQKTEVLALIEKQDKERMEQVAEHRKNRDAGSQVRDAKREEMRAARLREMEKQKTDLENIIGKEKAEKWNDLRKDVRDTNRSGRRNPVNRSR